MGKVQQESIDYLEIPTGMPVPGKTMKRVVQEIDLDTVALQGGLLVKARAFSWDPYMRPRLRDPKIKSYSPAFELNKPLTAFGCGEVIRSESSDYPVGSLLVGIMPMQTYPIIPGAYLPYLNLSIAKNDAGLPASTLIGGAGMPGQTAYWSFYTLSEFKKGETIFVSAAAGAVGQIVCQLAKREGLKVVASAGDEQKVKFLKEELGVDVAFNYKTESTDEVLKANPFDIFYDNVGGETLDLALANINTHGRIICCGSVSQYNLPAEERYGLKNTFQITAKELKISGFILSKEKVATTKFWSEMPAMIKSGDIKVREHITNGFDDGESFVDMLTGKAQGKAVISLE